VRHDLGSGPVREARGLQLVDRLVPDAARREVHDPQQRDLVERVVDRLQVGDQVADLLAVVEAMPPITT